MQKNIHFLFWTKLLRKRRPILTIRWSPYWSLFPSGVEGAGQSPPPSPTPLLIPPSSLMYPLPLRWDHWYCPPFYSTDNLHTTKWDMGWGGTKERERNWTKERERNWTKERERNWTISFWSGHELYGCAVWYEFCTVQYTRVRWFTYN